MDNRPIGIFDSGLGGLTGLCALRELLPQEDYIYFADSGRVPYGEKTQQQLRPMALQNLTFISSFNVKAILVACGTLSANAADLIGDWVPSAFGVLRASADWAGRLPGSGAIAVAATEASIRSEAYQQALRKRCPERKVLSIPCPDFVPLIEGGHFGRNDPLLRDAVERYLRPARDSRADALILGCTHYGLISDSIRDYLGPEIQLISAAESGAVALCSFLLKSGQTCEGCKPGGQGSVRYFTSGSSAAFSEAAARFLHTEPGNLFISSVEPLPIPAADS